MFDQTVEIEQLNKEFRVMTLDVISNRSVKPTDSKDSVKNPS